MSDGNPRSRGRLVNIFVSMIAVLVLAAIFWPAFPSHTTASVRTHQLSDIKQIGLCMVMYANDYDDRLPLAMSSNDDLRRYGTPYTKTPGIFKSVNPAGGQIQGNGLLAGRKLGDVIKPETRVMIYDSRPWVDKAVICYADGHAKSLDPFEKMLEQLTVDPMAAGGSTHREPAHE